METNTWEILLLAKGKGKEKWFVKTVESHTKEVGKMIRNKVMELKHNKMDNMLESSWTIKSTAMESEPIEGKKEHASFPEYGLRTWNTESSNFSFRMEATRSGSTLTTGRWTSVWQQCYTDTYCLSSNLYEYFHVYLHFYIQLYNSYMLPYLSILHYLLIYRLPQNNHSS